MYWNLINRNTMSNESSKVYIYLDDREEPLGIFDTPVHIDLNTLILTDGEHALRVVSRSPSGREGVRKMRFTVRNGPAILMEGIQDNEVVDGIVPLMINAYDKGDQTKFLIHGSESPHSVPSFIWIILILFLAWALYYGIIRL